MNFNLYLQHENRCIKNTRKNYSYCYLRPVVAILHYLHGNKQSLLFHPLILNLERTLFIRHQNGCLTKNCY